MRITIRTLGAFLASMAGVLLVSSTAWPQAVETPMEVLFYRCVDLQPPEKEWVDEDGVVHIRNSLYSCNRRWDMIGKETGWTNSERDPAAGIYSERGYYSFTGRILGGDPTSGVGHYTLEGTRIDGVWNYTSDDVMHVDGGGLVRLSGAWKGGEPIIYSGSLLETPGGASRNGPRSK